MFTRPCFNSPACSCGICRLKFGDSHFDSFRQRSERERQQRVKDPDNQVKQMKNK